MINVQPFVECISTFAFSAACARNLLRLRDFPSLRWGAFCFVASWVFLQL